MSLAKYVVSTQMVIEDGTKKIKIDNQVLGRIHTFCQIKKGMPEAGGILAGRQNISNNNIIIEHHTEPMYGDFQTRYRFTRKDPGHLSFFQELYNNSNGTIGYVGEWHMCHMHTHPEDVPQYSMIDLKNWRKIYTNAETNQVQYHLIAGRKALVIWKYDGKNFCPVKIVSIYWEDTI